MILFQKNGGCCRWNKNPHERFAELHQYSRRRQRHDREYAQGSQGGAAAADGTALCLPWNHQQRQRQQTDRNKRRIKHVKKIQALPCLMGKREPEESPREKNMGISVRQSATNHHHARSYVHNTRDDVSEKEADDITIRQPKRQTTARAGMQHRQQKQIFEHWPRTDDKHQHTEWQDSHGCAGKPLPPTAILHRQQERNRRGDHRRRHIHAVEQSDTGEKAAEDAPPFRFRCRAQPQRQKPKRQKTESNRPERTREPMPWRLFVN